MKMMLQVAEAAWKGEQRKGELGQFEAMVGDADATGDRTGTMGDK